MDKEFLFYDAKQGIISRPNKDFGRGFYLSADRQQAWRMAEFKALIEGGSPVINAYSFDEQVLSSGELSVLTFESYTRDWAEFIFLNRNNPSAKSAHDYDIEISDANTGLFFQSPRYVLSYIAI